MDVHQHLWPEGLIAALRARRRPPRMRGWTLELAGEPDCPVEPAWHDVDDRVAHAVKDGLDLALVSLSSPLGIEMLAPEEAGELLAAYHDGVHALPAPFGGWAAACLTEVDPPALATQLDRGFVGLQLPATALLDGAGYERAGPLLEALEGAGKPLLIHPGPVGGQSPRAAPAWWPAIVPYVQQMYAAWYAFRAYGGARHPDLRVCFAMLAGLAPLHGERFAARAGERTVVDDRVFLEVSSYGTRAIDATIRVLGIDALVNGSDRPYADPPRLELGAAALHALRSTNPDVLSTRRRSHMKWPLLPARNLDRTELQALVDELASDPRMWCEHVAFGGGQRRHYVSLHRDDYVDVWLLCWTPGDDTGWHDHDISSGAVRVVRGAIAESSPRIGGEPAGRTIGAGGSFSFGPDHIHRLAGAGDEAVSIHAYSPPLWRLGQYSVDADGVMRRVPVSYADELRPLEAAWRQAIPSFSTLAAVASASGERLVP